MNEQGSSNHADKLTVAILAVALVASALALCWLVVVDVDSANGLRARRRVATEVPLSGALRGQNVVDNSEWVAPEDQDIDVVLVGIAAAGQSGDLGYWGEVAARTLMLAPDTLFVGLCMTEASCGKAADYQTTLTSLAYMDPAQMRAVAMATTQRQVLIFRGPGRQSIAMQGTREATAEYIARISMQKKRLNKT